MVFNLLKRRIRGHDSVVLVLHLLSVGERIVEIFQYLVRLEILLLVINDSLEPSIFAYLLNLID